MDELVTRPDYLVADEESDCHYLVPDEGAGYEDAVGPVGEPDDFTHERLFMRPVPARLLDSYDGEDETGIAWVECHEAAEGATPWFALRYAEATS